MRAVPVVLATRHLADAAASHGRDLPTNVIGRREQIMSSTSHRPLESTTWDCATCAEPWPCAERRAAFLADYEGCRHELRAILAMFMYSAAETLDVSARTLHERFVAWSIRSR